MISFWNWLMKYSQITNTTTLTSYTNYEQNRKISLFQNDSIHFCCVFWIFGTILWHQLKALPWKKISWKVEAKIKVKKRHPTGQSICSRIATIILTIDHMVFDHFGIIRGKSKVFLFFSRNEPTNFQWIFILYNFIIAC